jgi:hypothetical protein
MAQEYDDLLNSSGPVHRFEDALAKSALISHDSTAAAPERPATACLASGRLAAAHTVRASSAMGALAGNGTRVQSVSDSAPIRVGTPRFLEMPRVNYIPGRAASTNVARDSIVDNLRLPQDRRREAERVLREASNKPSDRECFEAYHDHLKTLRCVRLLYNYGQRYYVVICVDTLHANSGQLAAKLSTLEELFDEKTHDPETLQAHMERDMALSAGARARGMYEHADARKAMEVAGQGFARVKDHRYTLLLVTPMGRVRTRACYPPVLPQTWPTQSPEES